MNHSKLKRHTNEVAVLKIESIQFITGLLRVHDILVDYKGRSFGIIRCTLPYLPSVPLTFSLIGGYDA